MKLINADCIEAMKAMPDNSVDSIVTDPPYELGFMGKSWDASGIAFNIEVWQEALRVIKPGGHLIAFSGSRTYHRMAVAIEDAGFQIRDQIMWVYGSGFPKSYNIAKGIEGLLTKGSASWNKWHELNGELGEAKGQGANGLTKLNASHGNRPEQYASHGSLQLDPTTPEAQQWNGWGTALKPAHEPIVLARKPLEGTVANNVLTFGVGGLNIDGTRVGSEGGTKAENFGEVRGEIFGNGKGKPTNTVAELNAGRFPANFIHDGSDEVVALFPDTGKSTPSKGHFRNGNTVGDERTSTGAGLYGDGAWISGSQHNDSGSAARFFYCAKASKRDRNEGLDGFEAKRDHDGRKDGGVGGDNPRNRTNNAKLNHHPTVKPTTLMQYLVRLVTPPNGVVLDPFMGSGSTGKACAYEGFDFIGIDQSAEYVAIAQARIDFALADKLDELPL
jgi:site-specific DNA-methyltransferase (adenine-specific)